MEARGIAAEIDAQRRLQRKARSRSDAPSLIGPSGTPVTIFGTSGITSTGNAAGRIAVVTIDGSASIVASDTGRARSSIVVRREFCGAKAAEPPRSAAPQATRDAKASRAVASAFGSDQRKRAAPPKRL